MMASDAFWETCPHVHLHRGTCVDCLADVTWDHSNVSALEARTRRALAGVRIRLAVYSRARGSLPHPDDCNGCSMPDGRHWDTCPNRWDGRPTR